METFIAAIFVALRMYTRYYIAKAGLGWDDLFMFASLVRKGPLPSTTATGV